MMNMLQDFSEIYRPDRTAMFSEIVGNLFTFLFETLFLYNVPVVILGKVSSTQKEIVPKMLNVNISKNALYIAKWVRKLQLIDETGYTIFDKPLIQLNTTWLSL